MNILQILPELNVGGVETGTLDLARYLIHQGHKSVVVSAGGTLVAELEKNGSIHYILPVNKKNFFVMFSAIHKLMGIIRREKVDIVHARSRVPAWVAFLACRRTQAVFMTSCHGYYSRHFFSRVMGWGKLVIAISEVIGQYMVQDFGVPSRYVRIIPRSVDTSKFNLARGTKGPGDPFLITMIGRLTPLKGHPFFLKAMAQVLRSLPNVKIQIIGDASPKRPRYKEELVLLTKRLGITHHVEFMGNRRDIPQLLAASDCLVLSTITPEAFGRVILEAQAAGVPVVATKVGGVSEIIDHEKTGLLVLPNNIEAMAQAVLRILKDRAFAASLVVEAQKKIEQHYTLKHMAEATLHVYHEAVSSLNILVIKLTALGDVVLATASLKALRQKFPTAQIHVLTSPQASLIVQRCPYVNGVIVFDPSHKDPLSIWRMSQMLRQYRLDKVIDLQNNRLSHLLSFLSLAKQTYGYHNGKFGFLLSHSIKNNILSMAPVEHQFRVLKLLGIDYNPPVSLELWPSAKDYEYAQSLLDSEWMGHYKDMVGLNISASRRWATKNWLTEHMVKLCDLLGAHNIRVILTGQAKDQNLARLLVSKSKSKPANFTGKTNILQLAALISRCRVYISPDSAPLHVASAMQVPVVAFFGPTDPVRHMPPVTKAAVLRRDLKCSPCYAGVCKIKTHACMKEITPEYVAQKVMELMR
ncbi:MAG: lipopolysaccharide heptosyltransferase II [Candidatus Omnitrophica bacterium]|nr:lipopolysaccharide heptosyltransferase II [Candidatus Omnitrophota bacterium]